MKIPVYYVWYELIVGDKKSRGITEMRFEIANKKAESAEEMTLFHNSATAHLTDFHGGEGRTVNITGMQYLRLEEVKQAKKKAVKK